MLRVLAAARFAGPDVRPNRNVSQRVQFTIDVSRNKLLSFFTTHNFLLVPAGWLLILLHPPHFYSDKFSRE